MEIELRALFGLLRPIIVSMYRRELRGDFAKLKSLLEAGS